MRPYRYLKLSFLKRKYHLTPVLLQPNNKTNDDLKNWSFCFNQSAITTKPDIHIRQPLSEDPKSASKVYFDNDTIEVNPSNQDSIHEYEKEWLPKTTQEAILNNSISIHDINAMNQHFSISQLLVIIKALFQYKKIYEIHQIYKKNYQNLSKMLVSPVENQNHKEQIQLVYILMETEYLLSNFHTFEELFSIYLKWPKVISSKITHMAFISFINTSNLTMCKDFFQQVMDNNEQYLLSENHLIVVLKKLSLAGEIELLQSFINIWVVKKYQNDYSVISTSLLRFIHSVYLEHEKNSNLSIPTTISIKKLQRMLKREYLKSADSKSVKFYEILKNINLNDIFEVEIFKKNVEEFLDEEHDKHALKIPVFLVKILSILSHRKEVDMFQWSLQKCMLYKPHFTYLDYVKLEKIIAESLYLKQDLDGLVTFVNHSKNLKMNARFLQHLNETFLNRYPFLKKAINPEYKLLLAKPEFQKTYPWCNIFLCKNIFDDNVEELINKKLNTALNFMQTDDNAFFFTDLNIKDKLKSCYTILQKYVNNRSMVKHIDDAQIDSVLSFLEKIYQQGHFRYSWSLPIKFEILKLQIQIMRSARHFSRSEKDNIPIFHKEMIDRFIQSKRLLISSDDYLRLANVVIKPPFKDHIYGKQLLSKSFETIKLNTKGDVFRISKNWYKFYMTSLKLSVKNHDLELFDKILNDWHQNEEAFFILPECITDLKGYQKYWIKRKTFLMENTVRNSAFLDEVGRYDELVASLDNHVSLIKQRFVDYEYQGLNNMQKVIECISTKFEKDFAIKLKRKAGSKMES